MEGRLSRCVCLVCPGKLADVGESTEVICLVCHRDVLAALCMRVFIGSNSATHSCAASPAVSLWRVTEHAEKCCRLPPVALFHFLTRHGTRYPAARQHARSRSRSRGPRLSQLYAHLSRRRGTRSRPTHSFSSLSLPLGRNTAHSAAWSPELDVDLSNCQ